jgi:hypothetical protein
MRFRRTIRECRVDLWLLPSGAPFVTISHYHGRNIYSAEVLADFNATYTKQISGLVFDQWRCNRDDGASGKGAFSEEANAEVRSAAEHT